MTSASGSVTSLPATSRAVLRSVEAGTYVDCVHCGDRVKYQAKMRNEQVICNVYEDGRWQRVEHYHHSCYTEAGEPWGSVAGQEASHPQRVKRAS